MARKLLVIKFGGSVLRDGEAIRRAAIRVKKEIELGNRVVVVVSAIKGMTDKLLEISNSISSEMPLDIVDHIIMLGEEQSARLVSAALKLIDVDAVEITPDSPSWPIITNDVFGNAEPLLPKCEEAIRIGIMPLLLREQVPVVCGFIGRSQFGNITTLGRGGTDTTAMILSNCLNADELVLVKDVEGLYSSDPKKVSEAILLDTIYASEAHVLASSGTRVLQDKIFKYKPEKLDVRIVSEEGPLSQGGTVIRGELPNLEIQTYNDPVQRLVIVRDENISHSSLNRLISIIEKNQGIVFNVINREDSISIILKVKNNILEQIHKIAIELGFKAVTSQEELSIITIRGKEISKVHSGFSTLQNKLQQDNINLIEFYSDLTTIKILVNWEARNKAIQKIREILSS
jgi:aspartate kinase